MMPKIGDAVYIVYKDDYCLAIIKEKVGYLGKDSFVVEGYSEKIVSEYMYDNYETDWFSSLEAAEEYLSVKYDQDIGWAETIKDEQWEAYQKS